MADGDIIALLISSLAVGLALGVFADFARTRR